MCVRERERGREEESERDREREGKRDREMAAKQHWHCAQGRCHSAEPLTPLSPLCGISFPAQKPPL